MTLKTKQVVVGALGAFFLLSLVFVQIREVLRQREERGEIAHRVSVPASSKACVDCHTQSSKGIVDQWMQSTHARKGVGCVECHQASEKDADAYKHYGETIATVITPMDCGRCHTPEAKEFAKSHHSRGGEILHSLDNFLAETVEGARAPFNPHSPTPGKAVETVNGMASAFTGCHQCHGSKVAFQSTQGGMISVDDFKPDDLGRPTNLEAIARILRNEDGRPKFHPGTWPNTGIGRINLDGSRGSCSACHSRHDFSPRRARQPENCGKCHLGPDHPQKEIYEESKHGVAFRDLREHMNLGAEKWVLGKDYSQAPTCATCHMSGHTRNKGKVTHDPGERISWTNRPPLSQVLDTGADGKIVLEADPAKRAAIVADTAEAKRSRMKDVCLHCHTQDYVNAFYRQYDDFVILFNEKFSKPGKLIVDALRKEGLLSPKEFDEEIEWTWYLLWHHEGRRARHGASMMAPDYAHWHGMFEVADRFYQKLIPQARELARHAGEKGKPVLAVIDAILARPEHRWFEGKK
jgi:hypothetical protein